MDKNAPNILLITTDQQRFDTIHAAGAAHMITPNLDRLVREGCLYENAYSPNPTCMAARHNIITGLPARYHGFDDNYFDVIKAPPHELPMMAQVLADNGYDTAAFGKMHFLPFRRHNGFNRMELMEEMPRYREDDEYAMYLKEQGYGNIQSIHGVRHMMYMLPQRSLIPEEHHGSRWVADRTIHYLEENRGSRPFMIWTSFIEPHPPFDVPERFADFYQGAVLPELKVTRTPLSPLAEENKCVADYPDESYLRRVRELYYAAITFVDGQIGRILDKLEETGQLDRTLIVFTSDHGEMLGDYGTYQKFLPYDGAAKIPMVIRYPAVFKGGSRVREFVDLNDLFPTFLDAAGLSYPDQDIKLPGASLLTDKADKDRDCQYVEHSRGNRRWVSLQRSGYKYNYYYGGGLEELFDMENDPDETENLLYGPETKAAYEAVRQDMRTRLIHYEEAFGLEGYVRNGDFALLEPYPVRRTRKLTFSMFPDKLGKEEQARMMTHEEEILKAVAREPVVRLSELNMEAFKEASGLSGQRIQEMIAGSEKDR
ncbi:sulfatase [Enterocloster aldenensis]|uniref:sulfatase family protein n=1 Tax=Enterocloster aldenensis TaxID=358742 RepID=UPI000E47CA4C|nr:DUF229 domain-containing protein [Enterocloster aldenensis]